MGMLALTVTREDRAERLTTLFSDGEGEGEVSRERRRSSHRSHHPRGPPDPSLAPIAHYRSDTMNRLPVHLQLLACSSSCFGQPASSLASSSAVRRRFAVSRRASSSTSANAISPFSHASPVPNRKVISVGGRDAAKFLNGITAVKIPEGFQARPFYGSFLHAQVSSPRPPSRQRTRRRPSSSGSPLPFAQLTLPLHCHRPCSSSRVGSCLTCTSTLTRQRRRT